MSLSVKHLEDALKRLPLCGPRRDPYPLRPPAPLPYIYRVDPLVLLLQIAAVVAIALALVCIPP